MWFACGVVLSCIVAFIAWQWLLERGEALATVPWPALATDFAMTGARALAAVLILGGLACWIVGRRAAQRGSKA